MILGIETSCDECSVSLVDSTFRVRSLSTYSQIKEHEPYGGVVPEVASRNHLEQFHIVVEKALKEASMDWAGVDAIAVTNRPGLIGALLVGVSGAKALAYALKKPLIPVHHLEGHLMSPWLHTHGEGPSIKFPIVFLLASGGHTQLHYLENPLEQWPSDVLKKSLLGKSIDDASGEAFDKTAKILGFPYPGGRWIDEIAKKGNPHAIALPRALPQKTNFDFSFSGLKTALALAADKNANTQEDLCASLQEAILDSLITKTLLAAAAKNAKSIVIAGGVSANSRLRERIARESSIPVYFPQLEYCTDNAAMIAAVGVNRFSRKEFLLEEQFLTLNAFAVSES